MGMWGTGAPTHGNYTYEAYVERVQAMQQAGPVPAAPDDPIELALGFLFAHSEPDTAIGYVESTPAHGGTFRGATTSDTVDLRATGNT